METPSQTKATDTTIDKGLEVRPRKKRRQWSAAEKRRIVAEAARCKHGDLGGLLRREGIYSTQLATWRRELDTDAASRQGSDVLAKKSRAKRRDAGTESVEAEVVRLREENARQAVYLRQLELVLSLQKKVAALCTHVHSNGVKRS